MDSFLDEEIFHPPVYGAKTQGNHLLNSRKVISGEVMSSRKNPKPVSFSANLKCNENALNTDTHNLMAMGMLAKNPRFYYKKTR